MKWRRREERERDLERELRTDLALEAEEQRAHGLSPQEAQYAARRAFGNATSIQEEVREMWGRTSWERLGQDLRYGLRTLLKNPAISLAAILTLALGIGANTAMFSVIYGVLFRPLPYRDPGSIALVNVHFHPQDAEFGTMSVADYLDWRAHNRAFEDPALFSNGGWRFDLGGAGAPVEVKGCPVTANFFDVLGARPLLGRVFNSGESAAAAAPSVVLSERFWRSRFAADRAVAGRAVTLNGIQATIIGVMPSSFALPAGQDLWTNIRLRPPTRRGPFPFTGIARLKPGIPLAQAQADTNGIARQIESANPGNYRQMTMPVRSLQEALIGKARPALLVMFGAVLLVLLIAAANVANLMLVRASGREREMAVRLSLGAARSRLLRQLLTESVLLAGAGGAAGFALAVAGGAALRAWNPGNVPRIQDVQLDIPVLAFTCTVSVLTGILFGLMPAIRGLQADMNGVLKQGGRSGTAHTAKRRTHNALIAGEVALSFMLLMGGGLLIRSFLRLQHIDPGFQAAPENVLTMTFGLSRQNGSGAPAHGSRHQRILDRVRALPGVASAALSDSLPPDRRADYDTFQIQGQVWTQSGFPGVTTAIVSPGYFQTLGIPLVGGRYFTQADAAPAAGGAIIISEGIARRYFRGGNPVGHYLAPSGPDNRNPFQPIIGVVADVKYTGLDSTSEPAIYRLYTSFEGGDGMRLHLVVRSSIAGNLATPIEREIRAVDPNATVSDSGTLDAGMSASVAQPRFRTAMIAGFAGVALLLAAVGIFGLIAYSVTQRTNEIGIRIALGAQPGAVARQIVWQGAMLGAAGIAMGAVGALLLTRVLAGLLFATSPTDPVTFGVVTMLLAAVVVGASLIPALRATRIDPVTALRFE